MVSNLLERRNTTWTIRTQVASDLTVRIGTSTFHLHKLPMISRSGYINRLVFQNRRRHDNLVNIQIDRFPGGPTSFESVVKFCYGAAVDLTASNIASLYCAANFLEMTDEYLVSNLVSRTEVFLSFIVLTSWKDTCKVLKGCETLSPWATELKIVKRCSEAIAARTHDGSTWCTSEDVLLSLRIDHFIEVVGAIKLKGTTSSKVVGDCIAAWTRKWLQRVTLLDKVASHTLTYHLQRVTVESLVRLLPLEKDSVSCNFLLKILRLSLTMEADPDLVSIIELRITSMLDRCRVVDLLVETDDSSYDYDIVVRVVKSYVSRVSLKSGHKMHDVGKLIDGFMVFVAREKGLGIDGFGLLVESLPRTVRACDDGLYRALYMYLKAHPQVTEEERTTLCKALDYHKLSNKARDHAMKNDRLPLTMTTRFILLDQVNFTKSVTTGTRPSLERTRTQMVIKSGHNKNESGNGLSGSRKEMIKLMREEVDLVKLELKKLQICKMEIQGQIVKRRIIDLFL